MTKKIIKNNWQIILFNIIIILSFIIFYGKFGDIIVDSFREAYIPEQILNGQALYKNIFTIYAPFAYLFNSLLFLLFGASLKVLYWAGFITTLGITNLVYKISNIFLDKNNSLAIVLFIISACILSPNVFNYIFPYSYGILYGLFFILGSLYFAIKQKFPYAYLLYSLAVCSKYEFLLLLPILIYVSGKKDLLKNLTALILPLVFIFTALVIEGVRIQDIVTSFQFILSMSSTKTLYWFYSVMGLVFRWELIPIYISNFLKLFVPVMLLWFIKKYWILPVIAIYLYFTVSPEIFIYLFPLILILFAVRYKKLNSEQKFFILASLLISMKVFFALTLKSYGVFFIPFALIPIFILLPQKLKKSFSIIVIISALILGFQNINTLSLKNVKIETKRGVIYSYPHEGNSVKELINYLKTNTKEDDKILIYPECLAVNFMADRNSDNKLYSLIPLYVETFGENLIKMRLERIKPEYIIISNYDTSNYYYSYFGQDYAGEVFDYILKNYNLEKNIGRQLLFTVFKRKP